MSTRYCEYALTKIWGGRRDFTPFITITYERTIQSLLQRTLVLERVRTLCVKMASDSSDGRKLVF